MKKYEVRYWLADKRAYASWLVTSDQGEANRVARDLQDRRRGNDIEVVEVDA